MVVIRTIALAAAVAATAPAIAGEIRVQVRAMLCDSPKHAIAYADEMATGVLGEIAKDRVGKQAGTEVCKLYRGIAVIEDEHVEAHGHAYKLTGLRFERDHRLAWLAERTFVPVEVKTDVAL